MSNKHDAAAEAVKAAPAWVGIAWSWFTGVPLSTWSTLAVLAYTVAQFIVLVRREIRDTRTAEQLLRPEWTGDYAQRKGPVNLAARAVMRLRRWRGKE